MSWESDRIAGTGGTGCGGLFLARRFGGSSTVDLAESSQRGPSTMTSSALWANNSLAWDKRNGRCWMLHIPQDSIREPIRVNAPVEQDIL
jgi:hypothetical protein